MLVMQLCGARRSHPRQQGSATLSFTLKQTSCCVLFTVKIHTLHVSHLSYLNNNIDSATVQIGSKYVGDRIYGHMTMLLYLLMSLLSTVIAQLSEHSSGVIIKPEAAKIQESNKQRMASEK